MAGVVVILNGYPGVGKTSVARELATRLPNAHIVQLSQLEQVAAAVHPGNAQAYEGLVNSLTQTLLSSLHPSPSTPIYLIPHTILASSPHRNRITPLLQLGVKGFHVIHIVLSSSTEVNVARLLQSQGQRQSRRGSAESTTTTATSGSSTGFAGLEAANDNRAGAGAGAKKGEIGNVLGRGTGVVDEASLLELRMEDEVLRLMSGIIGRRASASSASGASAASGASGKVGSSSSRTTASANASATSTIEGLEHHLSAEYEIDTSRLDAALTGMMAAEYMMDVMRRDGVLLGGAARKRSC